MFHIISRSTEKKKMVPIRYVFHTNISHFVKNAHVVKLYVAYVRILHIDKIPPPHPPKKICYNLHSIPIRHMYDIIL